jgi:hypothetical protein
VTSSPPRYCTIPAQQLRFRKQDIVDAPRTILDGQVAQHLPRDDVVRCIHFRDGEIEKVLRGEAHLLGHVGRYCRIDDGPQVRAPCALVGGLEVKIADLHLALGGLGVCAGLGIVQPDDDGLSAAVLEEIAHRVAEGAAGPQAAENPLEIAETVHRDRFVVRPVERAPDECGDGGGNACDGANAAWYFLNVNAGIADLNRHRPFSSVKSEYVSSSSPRLCGRPR